MASLGILQVAGYIVPFALLWIIGRNYNDLDVGNFLIIQSISAFSSIFIEYGFHLSAVRKANAAIAGGKLGDYLFDVHMSKLTLSCLAIPISLGFILYYVKLDHFSIFALCSIMLMLTAGFRPLWIFQAIGSYDKLVKFELVATLMSLLASASSALSGLSVEFTLFAWALPKFLFTSFLILELHATHRGRLSSFKNIKCEIIENSKFFLSKSCSSILHLSIPSILIISAGPQAALVFQKAERIFTAVQSFLFIISQVVFPKIISMNDKTSSRNIVRNYSLFQIFLSCGASLFLFIFAPYIINILWSAYDRNSSEILRILALSIPIIHISTAICVNYFLPARKDIYFVIPSVAGAIMALVLLFLFSFSASATGGAQAILLSEGVALLVVLTLWYKWRRESAKKEP